MTDQYLIERQKQKLGLAVKEEKPVKRISMAVCRAHHRIIEDNPDEAKKNGYSLSRLKIEK